MATREMQITGQQLNRVWVRDAALASLGFSLFLGFIGPLGDYVLVPFEKRMLGWTVIGMAGFCIYAGMLICLDRFKAEWTWRRRLGMTAVFGAVLLTPIVMTLDRMITGDKTGGLLGTYFTVMIIGLMYLSVFEALRVFRMPKEANGEAPPKETEMQAPLFMRHLPSNLDGALLCLSKEDHYLRVYTQHGDCLIRLRMSDAIAELESLPGQQTHRSWWVADEAVVSAKKRPTGGANAMLSNGLVVPISRARIPSAQDAGWFERG